jgi:hypothetical protein
MGIKKVDREISYWIEHGEMLSKKITNNKIRKEINILLNKLITSTDNTERDDLTRLLNSHKNNLGETWSKWVKSVSQKEKDKSRSKFYVTNEVYTGILDFIGIKSIHINNKNKKSDNDTFKSLLLYLSELGINDIYEMYDILDELNKFKGALSDRYSKDSLTGEKINTDGDNTKIIKSILSELKRNKIANFEKLKSIRSIVRNNTIESMANEKNDLLLEIEKLKIKLQTQQPNNN